MLISGALVALPFLSAPGRIVPETKLDLVIAPLDFLRRALHFWNPRAGFGQVENQAFGYLFPMGPFYVAGRALGLPGWVVQRAWMAALLLVGFWGMQRLAVRLGINRGFPAIVAGLAYALAPPVVTQLASTSGGLPPTMLLPWVLLPLVRLSQRGGSPTRAAARSALAVAAGGAINATATMTPLVAPALWLLTRGRTRDQTRVIWRWGVAVALACFWWVTPLLLQGRYGLALTRYTEHSTVTTAPGSAAGALRGTANWVALYHHGGPWLPAGWMLVSNPLLVLATIAVAAAGLWGLSRADVPERVWLAGCLCVGVIAIAAGYRGPLGSVVAAPVRTLLNGPLSPLRNIDKFEPLLRLPLAVGLGHTVTVLAARTGSVRWPGLARWRPVELGATFLIVGAAFPLVSGQLAQPGTFAGIPGYWKEAAAWLDDHAADTQTLVAPAAPFAEYTWGRPMDEPLESLAHTAFAVRNLIPLGSVGATRLLDQVSQAIDNGRGDPDLAPALARAGIGFVVIRNDLDPFRSGAPPPVYVRRTLASSAGLSLVASFGPAVSSGMLLDRVIPDEGPGSDRPIQAVEVYAVADASGPVLSYPLAGTVIATGGAESVSSLVRSGPATDQAVVLAADAGPVASISTTPVVTDGLQRRDIDPGLVRDNQSYVLAANEPSPYTGASPLQRVDATAGSHQTVAVVSGATSIKASSVASFAERLPENQPYSAFDGDPSTAWVPDPAPTAVGQWVEIDLDRGVTVPAITVQRLTDHPWRPQITDLKVVTDTGAVDDRLDLSQAVQPIPLPAGTTRRIQLVISAVFGQGAGTNGPGLAEIVIPGVRVDRSLEPPADLPATAAGPPTIVLNRALAPAFDSHRADEEDRLRRIVTLRTGGSFTLSGTAVSQPGIALTQALNNNDTPRILAIGSSTWGEEPAFAGQQAVDGDPATQWLADPSDPSPTLSLLWAEPRTIDSIRIVPAAVPSLIPVHVRLTSAAGTRDVIVLNDQPVTFAPLETRGVNIVVVGTGPNAALAHAGTIVTPPAVGIGEVNLGGVTDLVSRPSPTAQVVIPCGIAPQVTIDGRPVLTQAIGSRQDLLDGDPVAIVPCSFKPLSLSAGQHVIKTDASGPVGISGLTLLPVTRTAVVASPSPSRPSVRILHWGATNRSVEVGPGAGILATTENFNPGWTATLNGVQLTALRVDGWRQAWILPGVGGRIALRYTPDLIYRRALVLGALFLLALGVAALLAGRRRVDAMASRSIRGKAWVALASIVLLVLGGPVVLAVPALLALPRRARLLPGLAAGLVGMAGLVVATSGSAMPGSGAGAFGWQAQLLVLVGIGAALLAAVPERGGSGESA